MRIRLGVMMATLSIGAMTATPASATESVLKSTLDAIHSAGIPGVFAEVRGGGTVWRGASGVADLDTGRLVRPDMRQRVGSITKTFVSAAVLQQVDQGHVRLDAPIGDYLPWLVPGERGRKVTVRMLLNHTSGIAEYLPYAFPSLAGFPSPSISAQSLDDNRFKQFRPTDLIAMGLNAPATGEPGGPVGVYSNTNYLILGQLLQNVTGMSAENYVTRNVIDRAALRHTGFPHSPYIEGPHSKMYEALNGVIDPPRDYSDYTMSWVMTGAGLVSTMEDLNHFYAALLSGKIISRASLGQMQRTVPVYTFYGEKISYGLGLLKQEIPGCGTFWGNGGTVWGAETMSLTSADGKRQMSVAVNLARWNPLDSSNKPVPSPIDSALSAFYQQALCG